MIDFLKKHILHKKTLTIVAGFVAFGVFIAAAWILFSMPQEAEASNHCRVVDVSGDADIDASGTGARGTAGSDSDSSSINFNDYASDDEYVSELRYDATAEADLIGDCAGGDDGCDASAYANGSAGGVSAAVPPSDSDSETQAFTATFGTGNTNMSHSFSVDAYGSSPDNHIHGGSGYASISNVGLTVCEIPNEPPTAENDGLKNITYSEPDSISVLGNDYDDDNGPEALEVVSAWNDRGDGSSASPTSDGGQVAYDPGNLNPGSSDTVWYRISDGEDTDTARFDVDIVEEETSVEIDAPDGTTYTPNWDGTNLDGGNGDKTYYGLNLSTSPKIFEVPESSINVASGYTYSNMSKSVPAGDKTGSDSSAELGLDYTEYSPEADFTYSPSNPVAGESVDFTDNSSDPDGSINSYSWDFGDNSGSTNANPNHTYSSGGLYDVVLQVTDDDGYQDQHSTEIDVKEYQWRTAFTKDLQAYCDSDSNESDDTGSFGGEVYSTSGNEKQVEVRWTNHASRATCPSTSLNQDSRLAAAGAAFTDGRLAAIDSGGDDGSSCSTSGSSNSLLDFSFFGDSVYSSLSASGADDWNEESNQVTFSNFPSGSVTIDTASSDCQASGDVDYSAKWSVEVREYVPQ